MKWLLLLLFLVGVYLIFFKKPKTKQKNASTKESIMLECHRCGTYVASDEAIVQDGKFYCSKECAQC